MDRFTEEWYEKYQAEKTGYIKKKPKIEEIESKYRNTRTTVNGNNFDSIMEARYYEQLLWLEKAGEVIDIELQPRFELLPSFTSEASGKTHRAITYVADFKVTYKDESIEIIDVKGHRTNVFNIKYKMFEYYYPDIKLKLVTEI